MLFLNCLTHKRYARELFSRLCSLEAVELCDIRKTPLYKNGYLLSMGSEGIEEDVVTIKNRLSRIFQNLDAQPPPLRCEPPQVGGDTLISLEEEETLKEVERSAARLGVTREVLLRSKERIRTYLSKVESLFGMDLRIEDLRDLKYLYYSFGIVPSAQMPRLLRSLEDLPHVVVPVRGEYVFVFGLKRDKDKIDEILKTVFFERLELPKRYRGEPESVAKLMELELKRVDLALESLKLRMRRLFLEKERFLNDLWHRVVWRYISIEVRKLCGRTGSLIAFSGWVPETEKEKVERLIDEVCDGRAIYEWLGGRDLPKGLSPPTLFKNKPYFKPFEVLVRLYGIPTYGEVDPTPFIALSYPLFFGFMFGDLGQGGVLYLLSEFGKRRFPSLKDIFSLLKWCSIFSMIFGILYGHLFGFESVFKPILFSPIHDIPSIMMISLGFGVFFITLGYLLSAFTRYRIYGFGSEFLLDKHGVAGLLLFLALVFALLFLGKLGAFSALLLLPPMIMIYLGFKERTADKMERFFSPLIFLLENFSNAVSFIRLGAFALNHSFLFLAFLMLGEMLKASFMGEFGTAIMVFLGNAVVILFEGFIVSIQALRLNLYEFFSKFYMGEGRPFKPLSYRDIEIG